MTSYPSSVESLAALYPSCVLAAPVRRERILCGCCHRTRDSGNMNHPVLGELCVWCAPHFDWRFDSSPRRVGLRLRDQNSCATCLELGEEECPSHGI